jgi:hypothetical protein
LILEIHRPVNLLWLGRNTLVVLSLRASLDVDEVLADVLGKVEGDGILLRKVGLEAAKQAPIGVMARITGGSANLAEPLVGQGGLLHGRINTVEVERSRAAIAAHEVADATAGAAVVIVVVLGVC